MPVNQYLTDRTFINSSAITTSTLIHVVDTSDISQNPAGSSYKADLQQVSDFLQTIPRTFYYKTTTVTASTETLTSNYNYYGVTFSGNCDVTLPDPTTIEGFTIVVKDEKGNAGSYRIRVDSLVGNIDSNTYVDMNINNISLTFLARNNNWWII